MCKRMCIYKQNNGKWAKLSKYFSYYKCCDLLYCFTRKFILRCIKWKDMIIWVFKFMLWSCFKCYSSFLARIHNFWHENRYLGRHTHTHTHIENCLKNWYLFYIVLRYPILEHIICSCMHACCTDKHCSMQE